MKVSRILLGSLPGSIVDLPLRSIRMLAAFLLPVLVSVFAGRRSMALSVMMKAASLTITATATTTTTAERLWFRFGGGWDGVVYRRKLPVRRRRGVLSISLDWLGVRAWNGYSNPHKIPSCKSFPHTPSFAGLPFDLGDDVGADWISVIRTWRGESNQRQTKSCIKWMCEWH